MSEGGRDLSWMSRLQLPDFPIRWEPRLVRYLEFFKDDPRGRSLVTIWIRRSGRYREMIKKVLRKKGMPEDLMWLAMIESGYDPSARSPAGAVGLWQFMVETGRQYGLGSDRWIDHRFAPQAATEAATDFLNDLHRRFGSWELAIASYNMGYLGVVSTVRKYNTNDYWTLCRFEGAIPWETTLYVPKIMAAAVVMRNLGVFGFDSVIPEPPVEFDEIAVPPGVSLASVAQAAGVTTKEVESLNTELRAGRTPPHDPASSEPVTFTVRVPLGKGAQAAAGLGKKVKDQGPLERYVVRFGETLDQIAQARGTTVSKIVEANGIGQGEVIRGGTALLVPRTSAVAMAPAAAPGATLPVVAVPAEVFVYPDRRRVFYRVLTGDSLSDVATAFKVTVDDLRRWNDIDPAGRLQEGMTLQLFVPRDADLSRTVSLAEGEVRPLAVGSEEFFTHWESQKNRRRVTVKAKAGETLEAIGKRHGLTPGTMERINRKNRHDKLAEGDSVVLYLPQNAAAPAGAPGGASELGGAGVEPLGPLPAAPAPDSLPPLTIK